MRIRTLLLASAVFAIPGAAISADIIEYVPPPIPETTYYDWSGGYAGGQIGYAWGKTSNDWSIVGSGTWLPDGDISYSGIVGGVHLGFLGQNNSIVYGLEADINASGVGGNDNGAGTPPAFNKLSIDYYGTLRVRFGVAHDRTMLYGTGGLAYAHLKKQDTTNVGSGSSSALGWTIGGGVEHAFSDRWRARLEYQYLDFGSQTTRIANPIQDYDHRSNKLNMHTVKVGMSYRF